ncbi:M50 family metallopeptidase [Halalkalibacter suaedae]|uniref:M50 family metallopeptidase n=1 Tax=Halalkalibacter suaedae TaxID=2822140 RepID=A0A941AQ50_9BACI|nr:M50 family metallopeptidase [Bacillus suaedae]MBP3950788.1 M50 family metallopeptidase [Bacillus suaedae]
MINWFIFFKERLYFVVKEGLSITIIFYIIIACVISFIPILRTIFGSYHTLIHETGHAIIAIITRGNVRSISLFSNTEGVAHTSYRSWFGGVITSYFGYTFATLFTISSFFLIYHHHYTALSYCLIVLATINLFLWVRNTYGILWLICFLSLMIFIEYNQLLTFRIHFLTLLSSILLVQSLLSSFIIFRLSIVHSKGAGDATSLNKLTAIPTLLWGLLFFVQALYGTYFVITNYL